jgi:hypothetical protein
MKLKNFMTFYSQSNFLPGPGQIQRAGNASSKASIKSIADSISIYDPLPARFMKKGRFSSRNLVYKKALGLPNFQITLPIIVGGLLAILQVQSSLFV